METPKKIQEQKVSELRNLSDNLDDIFSKRLSIISDEKDLQIIGFKVKVDGGQAYSFTLDKDKNKSADVVTILADSKKLSESHATQEHKNSGIITNFSIPNVDGQTLPQTEITKSGKRFEDDSGTLPVLQLNLTSNCKENKEFEVHIKSKNDANQSVSKREGSNSDCQSEISEFSNENPRISYSIKQPQNSKIVPLKYVMEVSNSETQTERETESSSVQTTGVEVREPACTKETTSQTDKIRDASTITEEKETESVEIETIAIPMKQVAIQTEKETVAGSSQTETAAIYSIERAYDNSTQTERVENAGTSTDFDIYIVDREKVTEKAVDTEDLPFAPLIVAKDEKSGVVNQHNAEKSCNCSWAHRNHNKCIYKCCLHKEHTNALLAGSTQCPFQQFPEYSNGISQCNFYHCRSKNKCSRINKCEENFRTDVHQLYCCKCSNLNTWISSDTHQRVIEKLKASEAIRKDKVNVDTFAVQEKVEVQPRLQIGKNLKHELKKITTIIATKVFLPSKVETVGVLKIPVVFEYYLSSFNLTPSRAVINPVDITLSINESTAPEKSKNGQIDSNVKQSADGRLKNTIKDHILMFCDGKKTKSVIFSPKPITIADGIHPQVCLCNKCYSNVHSAVERKCAPYKGESKSRGTPKDQSSSTSPKIKHRDFNYTSKDTWKLYEGRSDDVLVKEVEATDIIYAGENSSEESLENEKSIGLNDACGVVNDHLLSLRPVDENTVRKAAKTLHKLWFDVAGTKHSDVREVRNYIQFFEEFSNNLLKTLLHSVDNNGNNVLHFAFANNRFDLAEEFLENGLTGDLLKKTNKTGNSPLMICSISQPKSTSDWSIVRRTFEMGDVNAKSTKTGQTPLMNASSCGFQAMVDLLLDIGANPNLQDKDGSTALMYAAEHGHEKCTKSLVRHKKCDPTIRDKDGQTACSIALSNGYKNIAVLIHMQAMEKRRLSKNSYLSKRYVWTNNKTNTSRKKTLSRMPRRLLSVSSDSLDLARV